MRVQPLRAIDRTLGTDGAPVPFAMVEVEVVNGGAFQSALTVRATGALVGVIPQATTVLGVTPGGRRRATATIAIVNTQPVPGLAPSPGQEDPWTRQTADLALEVRPLGGGDPVTTLAADTAYELHYSAGTSDVNGYALFAIAGLDGQSIAQATPPSTGDWSDTDLFVYMDITDDPSQEWGAPGYEDGYYRYDLVSDDLWPCVDSCAAPLGHLCDFTTEGPGWLTLQLIMYQDDLESRLVVEMEADAEFEVVGSWG